MNSQREKFPDASHHVYAWVIGGASDQIYKRFSDDGEPHGTSGPPVLDVLVKRNIVDTVIVVTRYFGGTLLGTGGLVKAYGSAASGVIRVAGLQDMLPAYSYRLSFPYRFVDQLTHRLGLMQITIANRDFQSSVHFHCLVNVDKLEVFLSVVQEICLGQVEIEKGDLTYLAMERNEEDNGE